MRDAVKPGNRRINHEIVLVRYYPNPRAALPWYQDAQLCKQVDNMDGVYDLALLRRMYNYLNRHGDLFYIKYKGRLCGDVCLQTDGEVNIVIAGPYQNRHIGRRVVGEIIHLAREKNIPRLHAQIYAFNTQSRRMFLHCGFTQTDTEHYVLDV